MSGNYTYESNFVLLIVQRSWRVFLVARKELGEEIDTLNEDGTIGALAIGKRIVFAKDHLTGQQLPSWEGHRPSVLRNLDTWNSIQMIDVAGGDVRNVRWVSVRSHDGLEHIVKANNVSTCQVWRWYLEWVWCAKW